MGTVWQRRTSVFFFCVRDALLNLSISTKHVSQALNSTERKAFVPFNSCHVQCPQRPFFKHRHNISSHKQIASFCALFLSSYLHLSFSFYLLSLSLSPRLHSFSLLVSHDLCRQVTKTLSLH